MDTNVVKFEMACGISAQLPPSQMPEVVFSGRSNVGKSSLINRLVNRKGLARVSSTPGKTATINFFTLKEFMLVDLPGYGYAKVSRSEKERWGELVEGFFAAERNIALVVQICDLRHKPTADDLHMMEFMYSCGIRFIVVLTKADKLNKSELAAMTAMYREILSKYSVDSFAFSALSGEGVEAIREQIDRYVATGEE